VQISPLAPCIWLLIARSNAEGWRYGFPDLCFAERQDSSPGTLGQTCHEPPNQKFFDQRNGLCVRKWIKRTCSAAVLSLLVGGAVAFFYGELSWAWLGSPRQGATILVSGDVEAHQSVLGFKTVRSRIVELPFNESQWVKAGTLIARLDDADYRQQVAIAESTLEVQRRQLAAAEQNLAAVRKTVESDGAES